MGRDEILDFLRDNKEFLFNRFHVTKIGLFGSFARNEQTDSSDIDIIFELEEGTARVYDLKQDLREYLSNALHRNVDLAREKYLKPYAVKHILKDTVYV